jgi:transcriptional regulator with XRE-family HTH domain
MNQRLLGSTIAALRKKSGLTQAELAANICVIDKAISKWERGLGYPQPEL